MVTLPFGAKSIRLDVNVVGSHEVIGPKLVTPPSNPREVILAALDSPVGTDRLDQSTRRRHKVALILDDITRNTPTHLMIPPILERLRASGIPSSAIVLVIALGSHRVMTQEEIKAKIGRKIAEAFEIVNVSAWEDAEFMYLGDSSNGIPAFVNRRVAEADFKIGVGQIVPHAEVGFGGGAKIVLPGVCSHRTIDRFHAFTLAHKRNLLGCPVGPVRKDLEVFVQERVGLDFIVNAILTADGSLYGCVAGHMIHAHRAGVAKSMEIYVAKASKKHRMVIVSSFPADLDLWQSSKAIWSAEKIVEDDGLLLLVTPSPEGFGPHPLLADYLGSDIVDLLARLAAGTVEDPTACAAAIQLGYFKRRIRLGFVSDGLSRSDATRIGFHYFQTVDEAIQREITGCVDPISVGIITHGGVVSADLH